MTENNISESDFNKIIELITKNTGIVPRDSHKTGIKRYLKERLSTYDFNTFVNLPSFIEQNKEELTGLINNSTVNETYFFREEKQFDLLKTTIFPLLCKTNSSLNIWSAACSSGEEIYSLALLAKSIGINVSLTASDINTQVLQKCKQGLYGANSVRTVDGSKYFPLLMPYKTKEENFQMPKELCDSICTKKVNLSVLAQGSSAIKKAIPDLPVNQHIIFIRNVFIYFSREMRKAILKTLASTCLADDGYIFVSMNEVASFDSEIIPPELEKIVVGTIFYFKKRKSL